MKIFHTTVYLAQDLAMYKNNWIPEYILCQQGGSDTR